jgi:uncharacterized protein YjiS (DUF1127 family)
MPATSDNNSLMPSTPAHPGAAPLRAHRRWCWRLLANLLSWQQRSRTRRQLAQLNPHELADVGITEAERQVELDKPFWR